MNCAKFEDKLWQIFFLNFPPKKSYHIKEGGRIFIYESCWNLDGAKWAKSKKKCNKELLDKCEGGNEIAPLWHMCQPKWDTHAKRVQFYCPSSNYPAIVVLLVVFERTPKYRTSNMSNITRNRTVHEHQTVCSKTSLVT